MRLNDLLPMLSKVKKTSSGYIACCPAHGDRNPSMTLSETSDGRILMHCFSHQCSIDDICGALGIDVSDLFPDVPTFSFPEREPINPKDAFEAISSELALIGVVASDFYKGRQVSKEDYKRFLVAINRIQVAKDMVCH